MAKLLTCNSSLCKCNHDRIWQQASFSALTLPAC